MPKFIAKNKVRMHDTDMAGLLYFPRQFRFVHDAWEDLMEQEDLCFHRLFNEEPFAFVIVHCEADYIKPVKVGEQLEIHVYLEGIGNTSFRFLFDIYRGEELIGTAKTVHVTVDRVTRQKVPVPDVLRKKLENYAAVRPR